MDRSQSKQILLIADANPQNVNALETILTPDFDIKVATDTRETIRRALSSDVPALILLNIKMPAADMLAVCRQLKADPTTKNIPLILLSESITDDEAVKGLEAGAADVITKPFKSAVVKARIRTHLELKNFRDTFEKRVKKQVSELDEEIQERRDIEDTYRSLVEHARDGIAIVHDFKVKFANPAFSKMIGIPEKELIGAHLKRFISEEEFIKNTTRYSDRIAGLNLPRIYKSQLIHSNGSTIDVELNVSVIPYGRSLAALVFIRDMREEEAWQYCR
ncbi:MAG: PAS domain S-box protein [Desulfobacterales bacterium]|nr:PAS domain S-box protein [Desulfobacterales bacterium]